MDISERELCEELRDYRAAIRSAPPSPWKVEVLTQAYNRFTNPAKLRTDREHRICRLFVRSIRRELSRLPGWEELDSGKLARVR